MISDNSSYELEDARLIEATARGTLRLLLLLLAMARGARSQPLAPACSSTESGDAALRDDERELTGSSCAALPRASVPRAVL